MVSQSSLVDINVNPVRMKIIARMDAVSGLTIPEGTGLLFVRDIFASYSDSWYWFRTEAPAAKRKIPVIGRISSQEKPLLQINAVE